MQSHAKLYSHASLPWASPAAEANRKDGTQDPNAPNGRAGIPRQGLRMARTRFCHQRVCIGWHAPMRASSKPAVSAANASSNGRQWWAGGNRTWSPSRRGAAWTSRRSTMIHVGCRAPGRRHGARGHGAEDADADAAGGEKCVAARSVVEATRLSSC